MKNLACCGIFMLGLGVLAIGITIVWNELDARSNRIPKGKPAGSYEINMDDYF